MASTPTSNFAWNKPAQGDADWDTVLSNNWDALDTDLVQEHTHESGAATHGNTKKNRCQIVADAAARAAIASPREGDMVWQSDTDVFYLYDGAAWDAVVMTSGTSGNIVIPNGGTIGQAAGPLVTFDDTLNYLEITGCSVGIGTATPQEALDVVGGALRGQNVLTDSTIKSFRMIVGHYDNTEEALTAFLGTSTVSAGNIYFGGGSSTYNAATLTRFYAAADNVTLIGTEVMRVTTSGLGIGTLANSDRLLHAEVADAVTNAVTYAQRLGHITSGTAAAGFGTGIEFELEGADGTFLVTGAIENVLTDAGTGAEDADMVFKVSKAGAVATEVLRVKADNNVVVTGNFNPEADGTRSLGTQTTAQWANVWSDLYNGADYSYLNGWRTLEAEKYVGYPTGLAIGNEGFVNGQVAEKMAEGLRPLFAVTEEFIEYAGVRITPQQWVQLARLAQ